jgi:hypothetical protein
MQLQLVHRPTIADKRPRTHRKGINMDMREYFLKELNSAWMGTVDAYETGDVKHDASLESDMMVVLLDWVESSKQWVSPTPQETE